MSYVSKKVILSSRQVSSFSCYRSSGSGQESCFFRRDIVLMMTTGRFNTDRKIALFLLVLTLLVYVRAAWFPFISYDDNLYITQNHTVQQGLTWSGLAWAFTTLHAANWHPLTWLSLMLDVQLFGLRPGALHMVNVLFHAVNAVLLFLILVRTTGARWRSAFVAALFALHPLHVESVAWVAERKDVLSVFFGLLAIWAYVRYAERPELSRYLWAILFFILSLLSKPMLVTMPFLLLLLDYWPLCRISGSFMPRHGDARSMPAVTIRRALLEKIPLLALSALSSIVTVVAQKRGDTIDLSLSLGVRLANAVVGYMRYLGKTFWPGSFAVFYPHPGSSLPMWQAVGAFSLLLLITVFVVLRLRRSPWLGVGWFWFMGTLIPVIGLIQAGAQSIADRYTYIPLIGIFIMIAWEVPHLLKGARLGTRTLGIASVLVIAVLAGLTWRQLGFWRSDETLFRHALSVTDNNCVALASLAEALLRKGDTGDAYGYFQKTLRLCPNDEQSWYNLGVLQKDRGELPEAEYSFREALRLKPKYIMAWSNLCAVYLASGRVPEAIDALLEATRLAPRDALIQFNLGSVYGKAGRFAEAADAYRKAVQLKPDYADAWNNLGIAYKNLGRISEAAAAFLRAAQIQSNNPVAWYNLGILYTKAGKFSDAAEAFREAARLGPEHAASWYQLGLAYASLGKRQEALDAAQSLQLIDAGMARDLLQRIDKRQPAR
jgi:Flp pilus assembly protein TadD